MKRLIIDLNKKVDLLLYFYCFVFADSCTENPCRNGGTCVETEPIRCLCLPSYSGDFCQTGISFCLEHPALHQLRRFAIPHPFSLHSLCQMWRSVSRAGRSSRAFAIVTSANGRAGRRRSSTAACAEDICFLS